MAKLNPPLLMIDDYRIDDVTAHQVRGCYGA